MHVSTSTCLCSRYYTPDGQVFDTERAIHLLADAGFMYQDIDITHIHDGHPLATDNWEKWGEGLADIAAQRGVHIEQAHAHWYRTADLQSEEEERWNQELVRRSMQVISHFGKGLTVVAHTHTLYNEDGHYDREKSFKRNIAFFNELGEMAAKQGNRVAIEILFPIPGTQFGCCAEELVELCSALNDPLFGICWDFGHASIAGIDQVSGLKLVGKRLYATHCQDNFGALPDMHLMPFLGSNDWPTLMRTLREIGYQGNLDLEVHMLTKKLPKDMQLEGCRMALHAIEHLKKLYDEA